MKQILFVHQNFPGQYRYLAKYYSMQKDWRVYAIGDRSRVQRQMHLIPENITVLAYRHKEKENPLLSSRLKHFSDNAERAEALEKVLLRQSKKDLNPSIILVHPGWGEALYLKEIFPHAKIVCFFEFFFSTTKNNINFDPEFKATYERQAKFRMSNTACLLALDSCDAGVSPTQWQLSTHPKGFHEKIKVIHDGIDTTIVKRSTNDSVTFTTSNQGNVTLSSSDEIISYSVRNLEPSRGFHRFMRALPALQKIRPKAYFIIVGGDEQSYSGRPESGTWRQKMLDEVESELDPSRILFLGKIPYQKLIDLFSLTSLHLYWTTPFVLSWSLLEAMACETPILASSTPPVKEVVEDGNNGCLFDFFNQEELVQKVNQLMEQPELCKQLGKNARKTIVEKYDFKSVCLPQHINLINSLLVE